LVGNLDKKGGKRKGRIKFAKEILTLAFGKSIADLNARLPANARLTIDSATAAADVIDKIYGEIQKPGFNFDEIKWSGEGRAGHITDIDQDATLFSVTRKATGKKKKGKPTWEGTLTKTRAYQSLTGGQGGEVLQHGFLNATLKEYKLNEGSDLENQIARLLLEMASPSPGIEAINTSENAKSFLTSPLALKLAGLETFMFVPNPIEGKARFDKITELYAKITDPKAFRTLFANKEYKDALEAFKNIVQGVREAQAKNEPYKIDFDWGSDKYTLTLTMTTRIIAGAYARCANASFSVKEDGEITITKKQKQDTTIEVKKPGNFEEYAEIPPEEVKQEPIALFRESTETAKSAQGKARLTIATALGATYEDKPKPPTPPQKAGGKPMEKATGSESIPEGGKPIDSGTPAGSGQEYNVDSGDRSKT
jgi:hypothetical protein